MLELWNNFMDGEGKLKLNSFFKELNSKFLIILSNLFDTCLEGEFIYIYILLHSSKNLKINLNLKK